MSRDHYTVPELKTWLGCFTPDDPNDFTDEDQIDDAAKAQAILALFDNRPESQTITIDVEGGVIEDIRNIPAGYTVKVRDFDTRDADEGDIVTEDGEDYTVAIWPGRVTLSQNEEPAIALKQGDWVLYNGKPRQVYQFVPFEPTAEYPAIIADQRFDMVELLGLIKWVAVRDVTVLREVK